MRSPARSSFVSGADRSRDDIFLSSDYSIHGFIPFRNPPKSIVEEEEDRLWLLRNERDCWIRGQHDCMSLHVDIHCHILLPGMLSLLHVEYQVADSIGPSLV